MSRHNRARVQQSSIFPDEEGAEFWMEEKKMSNIFQYPSTEDELAQLRGLRGVQLHAGQFPGQRGPTSTTTRAYELSDGKVIVAQHIGGIMNYTTTIRNP